MKYHFISSIAAVVLMTIMAIQDSENIRIYLLIPAIILFYITLFLFAIDYDKLSMQQWESKEKEIYEKAYADIAESYHKGKTRGKKK